VYDIFFRRALGTRRLAQRRVESRRPVSEA
jgi:hypothetical protein